MVTADEIARVSIFAALSEVQRERLSRIVADIRVGPGEYVVHAGDERALFAVLEGHVETVALVDGIERIVGGRGVDDLIGEVPIALGTTFPFGFRATEPSRVMRVAAQDYHAVVAETPEVGAELGKLARDRIGGLQGITADQPPPRAIVVGHRFDAACGQLRRFLDRNQVTFRWITPDTPEAADLWGGPLPGDEDCPVIRVVDGKTVVRPQLSRVAELLGLATQALAAEPTLRVLAAGRALTTVRGHCWFFDGEAADGDALVSQVQAELERGADHLKIMATGGRMTPGTNIGMAQYTVAELRAAVEEAQRARVTIAAHALGTAGIRNAIAAGVNTIEHYNWIGPDGSIDFDESVVIQMAAQNTAMVPTIMPLQRSAVRDRS